MFSSLGGLKFHWSIHPDEENKMQKFAPESIITFVKFAESNYEADDVIKVFSHFMVFIVCNYLGSFLILIYLGIQCATRVLYTLQRYAPNNFHAPKLINNIIIQSTPLNRATV